MNFRSEKETGLMTQKTDKVFGILLMLSTLFWIFAKVPASYQFIPFDIIYNAGGWLLFAGSTVICTFYFLYKSIKNRFNLSKSAFYYFLLSVITLLIMRFVYSITINGITLI